MLIQINAGSVQSSDALNQHVQDHVESALKHVADRVTRVEVHLNDENAHKSGHNDKRCTMEARLAGQHPFAVEVHHEDLYEAITEAANKLGRAVGHKIERLAER